MILVIGCQEALLLDSLAELAEVMAMSDYELLMIVIAIVGLVVAVIR